MQQQQQPSSPTSSQSIENLLDFGSSSSSSSPQQGNDSLAAFILQPTPLSPSKPSGLRFSSQASLAPKQYQQKWTSLPQCATVNTRLRNPKSVSSPDSITSTLAQRNIKCLASGNAPNALKFYFYAAKEDDSATWFMVETLVSLTDGAINGKVKCDDERLADQFIRAFEDAIQSI